jgi:hypothetical protein
VVGVWDLEGQIMSNGKLSIAIYVLVLFFGVDNLLYAQEATVSSKKEDLAARQLENVHIKAQSIRQLFSNLSLSYDVPIGLETVWDDDDLDTYSIDFNKGTLSELLTQFITHNYQYTWEIKDDVINVFPQDNYRDVLLNELLETKIGSFAIKAHTSCWNLENSLATTPEIRTIVEAHGMTYSQGDPSGFYIQQVGRHFTLNVSNMTLKSILNKVIKESPVAKIWIIKRDSDNQTFSIRINAGFEDVPTSNENINVTQQNVP